MGLKYHLDESPSSGDFGHVPHDKATKGFNSVYIFPETDVCKNVLWFWGMFEHTRKS